MYAIVDIETTGGNAVRNRIIEIAVFITDGENILDEFQTLINPERPIPGYITSFTGISNEMVKNAPTFSEVINRFEEMTEKKVFVAHNVNFDYSFLKKEYAELGKSFKRKKLCTVRLGRRIIPGMPSYGLGALCNELGIPIHHRHRAGGDAKATVKLFFELRKRDYENFIEYSLNQRSREAILPPNLPGKVFEGLPEEMGVYFFHDENGQVVYVGKAKNIKNRISSHFSGNTNTNTKRLFLNTIHDVSYELCGNELISLLYESYQIKKLWPRFNRSQKRREYNYGIYRYEDRNGYERFSITRINKFEKPVITFRYLTEARSFLAAKAREFNLCPKLCGLQRSKKECYDYKINICGGACCGEEKVSDYNMKFREAVDSMKQDNKSIAIIGEGRNEYESSVVLIEKGSYLGFGYLEDEISLNEPEELKSCIKQFPDNPDVQNIIRGYLRRNKHDKVIEF